MLHFYQNFKLQINITFSPQHGIEKHLQELLITHGTYDICIDLLGRINLFRIFLPFNGLFCSCSKIVQI